MHSIGQPHWTSRNSATLTREGYERNAVCHRCVRMVAEAAASVPWLLYEGVDEVPHHPLLALIERPNPVDTSVSFIEAICANLLLYGLTNFCPMGWILKKAGVPESRPVCS
jgi:phage portal protein BeeE